MSRLIIPTTWMDTFKIEIMDLVENGVANNVPVGHYKPVNFYVDSTTGRLVVEFDDIPIE